MNALNANIGIANIGLGMIVMFLALPLVMGVVKRNLLNSVRIPTTLASQQVWKKVNQFWGRHAMLWSVPLVVLGFAAFFLPLSQQPTLAFALVCTPLILIIPCIEAMIYARQLRQT